jgi:hypothetical protein
MARRDYRYPDITHGLRRSPSAGKSVLAAMGLAAVIVLVIGISAALGLAWAWVVGATVAWSVNVTFGTAFGLSKFWLLALVANSWLSIHIGTVVTQRLKNFGKNQA